MIRRFAVLLFVLAGGDVHAEDVFKCVATNGQVVYQQTPCAHGARQERIVLPDSAPASPPAPPIAAPAMAATVAAPPPPPAPLPPIPRMYGCVRATDSSKTYISDNGNPAPYLAPYGMLDNQGSLGSQVSASAPELNRGKVTAGLVSNNLVWVQDRCRELSEQETCQALHDQLDENDVKLRNAFKSQQPPFAERDRVLREQLRGCG